MISGVKSKTIPWKMNHKNELCIHIAHNTNARAMAINPWFTTFTRQANTVKMLQWKSK